MPRKNYVGKNRFCPNSRQSEWNYLRILYYWLRAFPLSEMMDVMQSDEVVFDDVMKRLNSHPLIDTERTEIERVSRQSLHNIINRLSAHVLDYDRRSTFYFMRQFLLKPFTGGWLVDTPMARVFQNFIKKLLPSKKIMARTQGHYKNRHTLMQNDLVWQLSTGNVDNAIYRKVFKISSAEAAFHPNLIKLMQLRYKRFRAYDRNNMDTHTAYFLIMRRGIQMYYHHNQNKEVEDWDMLPQSQVEAILRECAFSGLLYITFILNKYPMKDVGNSPTDWD